VFAKNRLNPNILMETSNAEFIKQLVEKGEGISFLVREAVEAEVREGKLKIDKIRDHTLFLDVSIAYLKNQHLTQAGQAFLDIFLPMAPREKPPTGVRTIMFKMLSEWK
jgi:DNA-binding transcriptional LysR family regulator